MVISTEERKSHPQSITLSPEKLGKFYPHQLSAAYHMGYEDVEIRYTDKSTLGQVQERLANCIGYEIVDQGDNFCRIKTISHVSLDEFDQILRKVFLLLLSMGKNIVEILEKKEYARLSEVKVLEVTNNKLTDFCKRVLNVRGYKQFSKLTTIYTIAMYLEMVADQYRDICDCLVKKKGKLNPKIISDFKEVNDLFNAFYKSFYKFSAENVNQVVEQVQPLRRRLIERMSKATGEDILVLHALSNVVEMIYEMENANIELNI